MSGQPDTSYVMEVPMILLTIVYHRVRSVCGEYENINRRGVISNTDAITLGSVLNIMKLYLC